MRRTVLRKDFCCFIAFIILMRNLIVAGYLCSVSFCFFYDIVFPVFWRFFGVMREFLLRNQEHHGFNF